MSETCRENIELCWICEETVLFSSFERMYDLEYNFRNVLLKRKFIV